MRSLILALMLVLTGCGGGGSSFSSVPNGSVERDISPSTIDPRVDTATEPHVAITPSSDVAAANKLFVFLPGTQGTPDHFRLILRAGAKRGYHTVGINYPNGEAVGVLCANSADPNCYWDVRREVITGTDSSSLVNVNGPNSIVTRLTKAVAYLQQNYPDEGWGQYLAGGAIDWSKVIISGHSQGGGHAGVMTKLYAMNRACYFSSPADFSLFFNAPATWTSYPDLTATSRQYGFTHLQDPLVPYDQLSLIWQQMGLDAFGAPRSADSGVASVGSVHLLTTNATPAANGLSASPYHGITAQDNVTPLDADGAPVFDPIWGYLCFQ